jgi:L-ascorbate metabolism protein UlaG (beta-lactamase superfamily)
MYSKRLASVRIMFASALLVFGGCAQQSTSSDIKQTDSDTQSTIDQVSMSETEQTMPIITPISHATFTMEWSDQVIYVDPVGGKEAFSEVPEPTFVLLTDIHGDHFDIDTLEAVVPQSVQIIAPRAAIDQMPESLVSRTTLLENDQTIEYNGFTIDAVPMYNIPETEGAYHVKGRGNGYVLERDETRVYIAGDTGPIPEMKEMQNIDIAFVPMNMPYTMTPEEAAEAVLAFAPDKVYPYHFREPEGFADIDIFEQIVTEENPNIEVVRGEWYE